ncbi:uncharacterized protein [Scyliorhinus torazame]|uniref:uncharacterized protein n=1 Tax=Scyliorhinus torazame TaxID=75743 RepID=UPI003B58F040
MNQNKRLDRHNLQPNQWFLYFEMAAPADEYINIGTEPSDESNSIQAPEGEDEAKFKSFSTKEIENLLESLKNTESILAEKEKAFQSIIDNLAEREKIFNLQEKELDYLKESMKSIQSNTIDSALAEKDKALIQKDIEIQKLTHSLKQAEKRISEQDKEIEQLNEIMKLSEKRISEQDKEIEQLNEFMKLSDNKSLKDILKISEMDQLRKSLKDTEDAFSEKERELNITKQALQKIEENLNQREKDVIMPRRNYPSQSAASDVLRIQFINKISQVKDLEKIRAKLENQLKEKTEELRKFQEAENNLFEKQTELENRIKMSEKQIEIKDKEKMELTKLLQMSEKRLTDARKDQDPKYRTDDERLIQLRAELQKLREATRQQLLDKDSALNAALLSHQDKENRLSNKTAEIGKLKSTLQTLEGKLNETVEDLQKCEKPQREGDILDDHSSSRTSFGTDVLRLQLVSTYKENKDHKRTIEDLETQLRTTVAESENTKRSNEILLQEKDSELRVFERNLTLAELKLSEREAELNRLKRSPPEENIRVKRASAGGDWQSKFEKLEKQLNEKETELMEAHESEFVLQANHKKLQKAIRDSSADLKSKESELTALSSVLQQTEVLLNEREKELDAKCKSDSQKIAELRAENKELRASKMKGIISTEQELSASAKSLNDCESDLATKTARIITRVASEDLITAKFKHRMYISLTLTLAEYILDASVGNNRFTLPDSYYF